MLIPLTVLLAVLPDVSSQVPVADCPAASALTVWLTEADSTPTRSVQLQVIVTSELFQPDRLAAGKRLARAIVGLVVSTTWTTKVVETAALPASSLASQVTIVLPRANCVPEAGEQDATPSPSTASEVAGLM